jgi:hypothetical protein
MMVAANSNSVHLVLAAPDIDAETFEGLADSLRKLSDRVTLYVSRVFSLHLANQRVQPPTLLVSLSTSITMISSAPHATFGLDFKFRDRCGTPTLKKTP